LEVAALQRAARATLKAYEALIAAIPTAKNERDLEVAFGLQARLHGDDVGYGTIVASGSHACVLHWTNNSGALKRGDLVLIDAGVESDALYTTDVTRVFPVSGKFSEVQRQVVNLVLKAQAAAMGVIKQGAAFLDPHRAAMGVLAEGLIAWGILGCTLEEALDPKNMFYRRYTLHGTSHMLGLDVHDCSDAPASRYRDGKLEPGMVITVEPGLYFQTDDRTVPRALRGIGVRIEDDVLVTPTGHRNLTKAIPKTPADVEAWMKRVRRCWSVR
jgi:Xaa-Pro aminopeptidase